MISYIVGISGILIALFGGTGISYGERHNASLSFRTGFLLILLGGLVAFFAGKWS